MLQTFLIQLMCLLCKYVSEDPVQCVPRDVYVTQSSGQRLSYRQYKPDKIQNNHTKDSAIQLFHVKETLVYEHYLNA